MIFHHGTSHWLLVNMLQWQPFRERNPKTSVAELQQHIPASPENDVVGQNIKSRRNITGKFCQYRGPSDMTRAPHIWTVVSVKTAIIYASTSDRIGQLRNSCLAPNHSSKPAALTGSRRTLLQNHLYFHALELFSSFRQAPGCQYYYYQKEWNLTTDYLHPAVNKISQSPGIIAICTATIGGQADEDEGKVSSRGFVPPI